MQHEPGAKVTYGTCAGVWRLKPQTLNGTLSYVASDYIGRFDTGADVWGTIHHRRHTRLRGISGRGGDVSLAQVASSSRQAISGDSDSLLPDKTCIPCNLGDAVGPQPDRVSCKFERSHGNRMFHPPGEVVFRRVSRRAKRLRLLGP